MRSLYNGKEMPKELAQLVSNLEGRKIEEVRRDLTPIYQKLSTQGKMPEPMTEIFREIQKVMREAVPAQKEGGA